jgi:hypothetical protein
LKNKRIQKKIGWEYKIIQPVFLNYEKEKSLNSCLAILRKFSFLAMLLLESSPSHVKFSEM